MIETPVPIAVALLAFVLSAALAYVTWSFRTVREANRVVGTKTADEETKRAQDDCIDALQTQVTLLQSTVKAQAETIRRQAETIATSTARIAKLESAFALLEEVRGKLPADMRLGTPGDPA